VYINQTVVPHAETVKYLGLNLDKRLNWKNRMKTKRKQLNIKHREIYWLIRKHSPLSLANKLLIYRVSEEEYARLREIVPYVKVYRYNPKHLYPNLNGYGDNGQRKVGASCGSKYCNLHS